MFEAPTVISRSGMTYLTGEGGVKRERTARAVVSSKRRYVKRESRTAHDARGGWARFERGCDKEDGRSAASLAHRMNCGGSVRAELAQTTAICTMSHGLKPVVSRSYLDMTWRVRIRWLHHSKVTAKCLLPSSRGRTRAPPRAARARSAAVGVVAAPRTPSVVVLAPRRTPSPPSTRPPAARQTMPAAAARVPTPAVARTSAAGGVPSRRASLARSDTERAPAPCAKAPRTRGGRSASGGVRRRLLRRERGGRRRPSSP